MPNLSRRDLLRATAGAALVAVPMSALASSPALAASDAMDDVDFDESAAADLGPVLFCISDAARGEVSILHGTSEVVVQDRRLVARIMAAANVPQSR
jgi:hypothetical protein